MDTDPKRKTLKGLETDVLEPTFLRQVFTLTSEVIYSFPTWVRP